MARIEASVIIARSIEEVFAFVTDYTTHPQWQSGLIEAVVTTDGPIGVGSQYIYVMEMVGQRVETAGEITEHEPYSRHFYEASSGPFPLKGGFTLESVNGGTKLTAEGEAEPRGFFKLADGIFARNMQKQMESSLQTLKEILEG